jgi:thioester reductase-like protein
MEGKNGYGQSKAVCEGLLWRAGKKKIIVAPRIYRMGTIGPDSRTGKLNRADPICHLWRVSKVSLQLHLIFFFFFS